MKALMEALIAFPNIFSVNFGECNFTKLANEDGIASWQHLLANIPKTGLGWLFADKEAGCMQWMVRDLLECCRKHRLQLQSFGIMKLTPWADQAVLDDLRREKRAPRARRHSH